MNNTTINSTITLEESIAFEAENATTELPLINDEPFNLHRHPTLSDYYTNITAFLTLAIFVAVLLTLLNISIYATTVSRLRRRLQKPLLAPSVAMCSFYPLISLAALVTILVPRSWLICHTVMHLSFTIGGPIYRSLLFRYVESEVNYIKETDGRTFTLSTPPCCCCCGPCLPALLPTRAKLCVLRYLVWQMPFVQGSLMLVLNVIYYRDPAMYASIMAFFIPFIIGSILLGMWSLNITVRMVNELRGNYALMKKMFALQLIVMLGKLQYLILDNQLNSIRMGGEYPINHTVYKQTIINLLILAEMVLVSMLVQSAYRVPVQVQIDEYHK